MNLTALQFIAHHFAVSFLRVLLFECSCRNVTLRQLNGLNRDGTHTARHSGYVMMIVTKTGEVRVLEWGLALGRTSPCPVLRLNSEGIIVESSLNVEIWIL